MNTISAKGKTIIGINIILYIIGLTIYMLYLNMRINPYIYYGMLFVVLVDLITLFSKYLLKVSKEIEPKLIMVSTIPLISLISFYIENIIGATRKTGGSNWGYKPL